MSGFDRISFEWARMLALPEGWKPSRLRFVVSLDGPGGLHCSIVVPKKPMGWKWWRAQAAKAIDEARKSTEKHP